MKWLSKKRNITDNGDVYRIIEEVPFENLLDSEYELNCIDFWIHIYKSNELIYFKNHNNKI